MNSSPLHEIFSNSEFQSPQYNWSLKFKIVAYDTKILSILNLKASDTNDIWNPEPEQTITPNDIIGRYPGVKRISLRQHIVQNVSQVDTPLQNCYVIDRSRCMRRYMLKRGSTCRHMSGYQNSWMETTGSPPTACGTACWASVIDRFGRRERRRIAEGSTQKYHSSMIINCNRATLWECQASSLRNCCWKAGKAKRAEVRIRKERRWYRVVL